jgi:HEPN domain-containing protein
MSANDDEILKKVKQWLAYADEDLRLARHGMTLSTDVPYRLIAYHAQQCAEKCLKAYLIFHHIDFPFTHNISRLLELCGEGASWTKSLMDSEELTFYAITTRYPGTEEEVTADDALRAINLATRVMESVSKVFEGECPDIKGYNDVAPLT